MAEPFASTRRAPTATSVMTMGASQYFLLFRINSQNSETTCTFDIRKPSVHFFVVARIALPFRIRFPVSNASSFAPAKRVPTKQSFHNSYGSHYEKENNTENEPRHDKGQHLGQLHPRSVWLDECFGKNQSQQNQRTAQWQQYVSGTGKLSAINPPGAQQNKNRAHNEPKLSLYSEGALLHAFHRRILYNREG